MKYVQEVLDLSIIFTKPPSGSSPETIAQITLQCEALDLSHTGLVFTDPLTEAEEEDLHWYLEEYWQWPYLEFAQRSKRVEALLGKVGRCLYDAIFRDSEAQSIVQVWQQQANIQHQISIVSEITRVFHLPWELLADSQGFLALHAEHPISVVRRLPTQGKQASHTAPFHLPLRVLLVTARPEGTGFIDPRCVSHELVDELQSQFKAGMIELEFLRPPTFWALSNRLKDTERSIHVLHFDGHGELDREAQQGVLLFETKTRTRSPVKASDVAKVLSKSSIRLAVLTACQSALNTEDDAFSSVSTQLINNGVDAVIAMSSSILVTSAALYSKAFYHALAEGQPVSIAQECARFALQSDQHRHPFGRRQDEEAVPITLIDWWVPHFYQQRPLTLHATTVPLKRLLPQTSEQTRLNNAMPSEPRYHFSGRARELLQIERSLLQKDLIILSGFGGVGKTALAREAADWLTRSGMYTSACFVSFEHGGDTTMLLSILGTFLEVYDGNYHPDDPITALARLKTILPMRPTLLIADNMESILPHGEAPLESEAREQLWKVLLDLAGLGVGVMLTSRDPMKGEALLTAKSHIASLPLHGLLPTDAYALATHVLQALHIPPIRAPYASLHALLHDLDHHPLAIQLVLPALHDCTLEAIRAEFASLLPAFQDDTPTGRNRSLLASLDYSLHRLSDGQRALLPRLAIFAGGALEKDLLDITEIPVEEWTKLRQALEQAALITPESVVGITVPFLHFHPLLAPYLHSQSNPVVANPDLCTRFTHYYEDFAVALDEMDQQHPQELRDLIRWEMPNLICALNALLETTDFLTTTTLAAKITRFLNHQGYWHQRDKVRKRVTEALIAAGVTQSSSVDAAALSPAEFLQESDLSEEERQHGDGRAAIDRLTRLLFRFETAPAGPPLGSGSYPHCQTLTQLAICLQGGHQPVKAETYLRQALAIIDILLLQQPEDETYQRMHSLILTTLADSLTSQGHYAEAYARYEEALMIDRRLGDLRGQAVLAIHIGTLALQQGNAIEARKHCQEALRTFHKLNQPLAEADAWHMLGMIAEHQYNWNEAEYCYREGLKIKERIGDDIGAAGICNQLGLLAKDSGHPDEAEGWYQQALKRSSEDAIQAIVLHNLSNLLVQQISTGKAASARLVDAKQYAEQALDLKKALEASSVEIWTTLALLATIADLEGKPHIAQRYRRQERESYATFAGNRYQIDQQHGPLINDIVAAARGDAQAQTRVTTALPLAERNGWHISEGVQRIWQGERNWLVLTEGVDPVNALLLQRVLERLSEGSNGLEPKDAVL